MKKTYLSNQNWYNGFIPWVDFLPPGDKAKKRRLFPERQEVINEGMHV